MGPSRANVGRDVRQRPSCSGRRAACAADTAATAGTSSGGHGVLCERRADQNRQTKLVARRREPLLRDSSDREEQKSVNARYGYLAEKAVRILGSRRGGPSACHNGSG